MDDHIPADPLDPVWAEYDSAAEYCARRGSVDQWRLKLPNAISLKCMNEINYDQDAFERRVRDFAYATRMEKRQGPGMYVDPYTGNLTNCRFPPE